MINMLGKAIMITSTAFENKTDRGGVPYIMHCLYVMDHTDGDTDVKCAAVMHDLIEDTDWTFEDLIKEGFSPKVINILNYMTHKKEDSYDVYIKLISNNKDAIKIKKADLEHNSCISRLKRVRDKDFDRIKKYNDAYRYLTDKEL